MVLSTPPAHATPVEHWLDRLVVAIELSAGGVLTLVDNAAPARLREAYLQLRALDPRTELIVDVRGLAELPPGSTVILAITPQIARHDLDWLNLNRPVLSERGHRVALWCEDGAAGPLARGAPDFFDWISVRVDCPPAPAALAVTDVRAAIRARAPGIAWAGPGLEDTLTAVRPGRTIRRVQVTSYQSMIDALSARAPGWLVLDGVETSFHLRRLHWAMAETGRRVIVFRKAFDQSLPGWWTVHATHAPVREAVHDLVNAGGGGRLAALAGLDPAACAYATFLLRRQCDAALLESMLVATDDPRAALREQVRSLGATDARVFAEPRSWLHVTARAVVEDEAHAKDGGQDPVIAAFRARPPSPETWAQIGTTAEDAGDDEVAIRWLTAGLRAGPPSGSALHAMLLVRLGQAHYRTGDLHSASAELEEAHTLAGTLGDPGLIARAAATLGLIALDRGEPQRARERLESALYAGGEVEEVMLASWHLALAQSLMAQKDLPLMRQHAEEALAHHQRALAGKDHPDLGLSTAVLGLALAAEGDVSHAISYLERALALQKPRSGTKDQLLVIGLLQALATVYWSDRDLRHACAAAEEALALQRTVLGAEHPDVAKTLTMLGLVHADRQDYQAARCALADALAIQRTVLGPRHPEVASTLAHLGLVTTAAGDHDVARAALDDALAIQRTTLGAKHPEVAQTLVWLGRLLTVSGDHDAARTALGDALAIQQEVLGDDGQLAGAATRRDVARLLAARGDVTGAIDQLERALTTLQRILASDDQPDIADVQRELRRLQSLQREL